MKRSEQGIALVITLFLMAALSALSVSMMFLSQTETAATRNYRTMSQARYAGEAGVHRAIHYLNSVAYTSEALNYANYDLTRSPVRCIGGGCSRTATACNAASVATLNSTNCVVLAANVSGLTSNYGNATVNSAFSTAMSAQSPLAVNSSGVTNDLALGTVRFETYAILMSMRSYTGYGTSTLAVQTWQIVSSGKAGPTSALATVEVMAAFEKTVVPAETFAVFATYEGCEAIDYDGNGRTDSYNSGNALGGNGKPVTANSGGAVGTNGNLTLGGTVDIYGNLSTPRTGVGSCEEGAITALEDPHDNLHGEIIQLPQPKIYPTPVIEDPGSVPDLDLSSINNQAECDAKMAPFTGWACTAGTGAYNGYWVIAPAASAPLNVNNLTIGSNTNIVIGGASNANVVVNANSFYTAGNTSLAITNGTTTMKLRGVGVDPVMDMQGNFSTTAFDPTKLQIMYAGTGEIKLRGSNELAATIYAPNGFVDMASGYDVYGSILAHKYKNSGGATVHYDTALASKYFMISNPFMSTFTWKKY